MMEEIERFLKRAEYSSHCIYCEGIDENVKKNPRHHSSYEITSRCNLKCIFCYSRVTAIKRSIKPGYYGDLDAKAVTISQFGEPFVAGNERVIEVIRGLRDILGDVRIDIQTNGTLLDAERIKGEADIIMISLDSSTREGYLRITKVDAFEKVIQNIKNLSEAETVRVIRTVYMPGINDGDIEGIARIAAEFDCELFLQPLSVYRENRELMELIDLDRVESIGDYIKAAFRAGEVCDVRIPGCFLLNLRNLMKEYEMDEIMLLRRNAIGKVAEIRREWRFEL